MTLNEEFEIIKEFAKTNKDMFPDGGNILFFRSKKFKYFSEEHLNNLKDKFINSRNFENKDVRNYKFENCSLVTSIFTLQFMPRKDRFNVLQNIYNGLNHGGAFIFAEKTVCDDSRLQEMITFNFYDYKRKHFEASDILEKEKTLRNMLKPNTWKELEGMLECAGFKTAQPFWRNHMFVGAIAIK